MTECLRLDAVGVRFGGLKAIEGVSIQVPAGQRHAIIGPNGAGKTTLFNAITGVVRATSGRVFLDGVDITRQSVHGRAHRGLSRTFQITDLFPSLTLAETMRVALRGLSPSRYSLLGRDRLTAAERERAAAALQLSRLAEQPGRMVRELSYGEQRQLELAMALATQPRLLLLDEPAAGLSPAERAIVSDIIRALPRDITVVLIEHDMDLVLSLVDWVTCLDGGRLLMDAAPADIRGDPRIQEVYLGKARRHA